MYVVLQHVYFLSYFFHLFSFLFIFSLINLCWLQVKQLYEKKLQHTCKRINVSIAIIWDDTNKHYYWLNHWPILRGEWPFNASLYVLYVTKRQLSQVSSCRDFFTLLFLFLNSLLNWGCIFIKWGFFFMLTHTKQRGRRHHSKGQAWVAKHKQSS